MSLLCHLLGHRRALPVTHNHGLVFTTCARCGADLVRERRTSWRAVPPGYRVVWKQKGRHATPPAQRDIGPVMGQYPGPAGGRFGAPGDAVTR